MIALLFLNKEDPSDRIQKYRNLLKRRKGTGLTSKGAAAQDTWESSGCICNMLEIAKESGVTGGNAKVALQL
jgi:hypothetical protein